MNKINEEDIINGLASSTRMRDMSNSKSENASWNGFTEGIIYALNCLGYEVQFDPLAEKYEDAFSIVEK